MPPLKISEPVAAPLHVYAAARSVHAHVYALSALCIAAASSRPSASRRLTGSRSACSTRFTTRSSRAGLRASSPARTSSCGCVPPARQACARTCACTPAPEPAARPGQVYPKVNLEMGPTFVHKNMRYDKMNEAEKFDQYHDGKGRGCRRRITCRTTLRTLRTHCSCCTAHAARPPHTRTAHAHRTRAPRAHTARAPQVRLVQQAVLGHGLARADARRGGDGPRDGDRTRAHFGQYTRIDLCGTG